MRLDCSASGGRTWWAHFKFTRINTTPTFLYKKFEELREARASNFQVEEVLRRAPCSG